MNKKLLARIQELFFARLRENQEKFIWWQRQDVMDIYRDCVVEAVLEFAAYAETPRSDPLEFVDERR